MEPTQPSKRGQKRRTRAKRLRAKNPPKYPIGTVLAREVIAKEDMVLSDGSIVKKGKKYFQSFAQFRHKE